MKCFNCGKGILIGHNVSHAKNRTRKVFKPNLHEVRILVGTNRKKVRLCTKCLRTYKKLEAMNRSSVADTKTQDPQPTPSASLA